jgi:hypothetical protein
MGTSTRQLAVSPAIDQPALHPAQDSSVPGIRQTAFADEVRRQRFWPWSLSVIEYKTAIFRQINKEIPTSHHDALEFPDGTIVLLTFLEKGQQATVLQLPVTHEGVKAPEPEEAKA